MIRRQNGAALLFLAPNIGGFLIFTLLPVAGALLLALFRWDIFHAPQFVGLDNFRELLGWGPGDDGQTQMSDPKFWKALWNSLFLMIGLPISIALSLLLAVVLNQKLPGRLTFRTIFFLPSVCAGVGLLLLWKYLYNPQFGLINDILRCIGIDGPNWLNDYHWAKPAILLMSVWAAMGGTNMILYLAGVQGIPPELYEAAQIDGAGAWQQFWHVTLPMLKPTTFFIVTTSIILGFQGEFDAAYVMTRGGPDGATTTLGYYIYLQAFEYFNVGYASAVALVMFAIILVVTLLNWRYAGGRGGYV